MTTRLAPAGMSTGDVNFRVTRPGAGEERVRGTGVLPRVAVAAVGEKPRVSAARGCHGPTDAGAGGPRGA